MLAPKLLLTPLLVGLVSLADRWWGENVGGWLVGLPLTSAPVTFFLASDLGTTFASRMAASILPGLISQVVFCLASAWLLGWTASSATTLAFARLSAPLLLVFPGVIGALLLGLALWPARGEQSARRRAPAWATPGRMLVATGVVLALTALARPLGPHLSGLLSPLPVFAAVFAIFARRLQGGRAARQILHGVLVSSFVCALFFLVVATSLHAWGSAAAFSAAALAALLVQGAPYGWPASPGLV